LTESASYPEVQDGRVTAGFVKVQYTFPAVVCLKQVILTDTVFWDARVAASGLPITQSRIPDSPDQTQFIARWFEFHQGYRIIHTPDGREEQIAVIGEELRDVDPGFLPRTLDELRAGRLASEQLRSEEREIATETSMSIAPNQSLDDTLDGLLEDAIAEEQSTANPSTMNTSVSSPSIINPRSTATTLPTVATTTTAQSEPQATQALPQPSLDAEYAQAQAALVAAQQLRMSRRAQAETAAAEEEIAREHLRRVRRRQITAGNFARVFGTREDIQSDDYVSPITSMFTRVSQWGQRTEAQRRALDNFAEIQRQTQPPSAELPAADLLSTGELMSNWRADRRNSLGSLNRGTETPSEPGPSIAQRLDALRTRQEARAEFLRNIGAPERADRSETDNILGLRPYVPLSRRTTDHRFAADAEQSTARTTSFSSVSRRLSSIAAEFQADINRTETNGLPSTTDLRRRLTEIEESISELRSRDHSELLPDVHASLEESERHVRTLHEQAQNAQLQAERVQEIMEARRATSRHSRALELLREARTNLERSTEGETSANEMSLENQARALLTLSEADQSLARRWRSAMSTPPERPSAIKGLDGDERPGPKSDEDMAFKLECRVCYSQVADTACLPCGHLAMCQWCADQAIPVKDEDRTRPKDKFAKCPMCRVRVKQRVKIFAC
jgi:hypothetical protein